MSGGLTDESGNYISFVPPTAEELRLKVQESLREIGKTLGATAPVGWGFALFMFEFKEGPDGERNMQWVSNAQRSGMIKTLREMADRLEHGFAGDFNDPRDDAESHLKPGANI